MAESNIYLSRGVSSSKSEIHDAIQDQDKGLFPGAFCKVLPDHLTGDPESCLLMHADGAGTKSSLAYVYWKETGDLSVFEDLAMDSLVMNLDDLACVGALERLVLSNTIGRNKFFIPGEVIQAVIHGYSKAIALLKEQGIEIIEAGGETADVGDLVRTLIVDSTLTARLKRSQVIDLDRLQPGLVIVGFASFGQAAWESKYNSGMGSNGLTAARHDCLLHEYANRYPESFSPEIPPHLVYCGKGRLSDALPGTPLNLGQAVLSPTRTYAPLIKRMLAALPARILGLVHCTGGGQTKCLKFGRSIHYIKDNLFDIPPLFQYLKENQGLTYREMMPVYNMGHRLEAFVAPEDAQTLMDLAQEAKIEARIVGRTEAAQGANRLTIRHQGEDMEF